MSVRRFCGREAGSAQRRGSVAGSHRIPDITYREITGRMKSGSSHQCMRRISETKSIGPNETGLHGVGILEAWILGF